MNEVLQAIRERRSIRAYQQQQIRPEELEAILDAGTWAASSLGQQSAVMVPVQDKAVLRRMSAGNAAVWGRPEADPFYDAPTAVVVFSDGNRPNWIQDGSLVMANLMLSAHALGIGSCWINRTTEYFETADGLELKAAWGLPDNLRAVATCVLGYPDGPAPTPKPRKENYIVRP